MKTMLWLLSLIVISCPAILQAEDLPGLGSDELLRIIKKVEDQIKQEAQSIRTVDVSFDGKTLLVGSESGAFSAASRANEVFYYARIAGKVRKVSDPEKFAELLATSAYFYQPSSDGNWWSIPQEFQAQFARALIAERLVQRGDLWLPVYWHQRSPEGIQLDPPVSPVEAIAVLANDGSIKYHSPLFFRTHVNSAATRINRLTQTTVGRMDQIIIRNGLNIPVIQLNLELKVQGDTGNCEIVNPPPYWTVSMSSNLFFDAKYDIQEEKFCSARKACHATCNNQKAENYQQCTKVNLNLEYWFALPRISLGGSAQSSNLQVETKDPLPLSRGKLQRSYEICTND